MLRLRRVVVKEHLQDVIIEKCGRDSLLSLIEMSRKIRDSKKIHDSVDKETEDPPKSRLSILIETQRGKKILGIIKCDRCHRKHSSGYLYTDLNGHEYKVCAYCCKQKIDYSYVIYTPMGNKR